MSNQIPKAYEPLVQLLEDAADGAHANGAAIGLKQNTEADIRTDLLALSTAESASNQSNTDAGTAQANFQAGLTNARYRASGLLAELTQLLDANDPRWLAFGFELPGNPSGPDVPANVVAAPGAAGSHALFIHWDDARRADGYRVVVSDTSTGTEVTEQLTQDAEVSIGNLPVGSKVNVVVSARNATGESQPTDPVSVVVP